MNSLQRPMEIVSAQSIRCFHNQTSTSTSEVRCFEHQPRIFNMSEFEIAIQRPQRWDEPFGEMTDRDVDALLRIEPFHSIDVDAFPASLPLRGILLGDTRIVRYQAGDVVVREGDYGNSAFLI